MSISPTSKKNTQVCTWLYSLNIYNSPLSIFLSPLLLFLGICLGVPTGLSQSHSLTEHTRYFCTVGMTTPLILSTDWSTRVKQIAKLWRKASSQDRAPYVVRSLILLNLPIFFLLSQSLNTLNHARHQTVTTSCTYILVCRRQTPLSHLASCLLPMQFEIRPFADELINIGSPAQC